MTDTLNADPVAVAKEHYTALTTEIERLTAAIQGEPLAHTPVLDRRKAEEEKVRQEERRLAEARKVRDKQIAELRQQASDARDAVLRVEEEARKARRLAADEAIEQAAYERAKAIRAERKGDGPSPFSASQKAAARQISQLVGCVCRTGRPALDGLVGRAGAVLLVGRAVLRDGAGRCRRS